MLASRAAVNLRLGPFSEHDSHGGRLQLLMEAVKKSGKIAAKPGNACLAALRDLMEVEGAVGGICGLSAPAHFF